MDAPRRRGDGLTVPPVAGAATRFVVSHLLVAAAAQVQAGYSDQPCPIAALRPRLCDALAMTGHPQVVLRLGRPAVPPPAAARRPLADVLDAD